MYNQATEIEVEILIMNQPVGIFLSTFLFYLFISLFISHGSACWMMRAPASHKLTAVWFPRKYLGNYHCCLFYVLLGPFQHPTKEQLFFFLPPIIMSWTLAANAWHGGFYKMPLACKSPKLEFYSERIKYAEKLYSIFHTVRTRLVNTKLEIKIEDCNR